MGPTLRVPLSIDGESQYWWLKVPMLAIGTAERRHPCYNFTRWHPVLGPGGRGGRHDDNWNGPSWPFETSKMLTAMGRLLNDFSPAVHAAANVSAEGEPAGGMIHAARSD